MREGFRTPEGDYLCLAMFSAVLVVVVCSAARATYWHMRRDPIERGVITIGKWAGAVVAAAFVLIFLDEVGWL